MIHNQWFKRLAIQVNVPDLKEMKTATSSSSILDSASLHSVSSSWSWQWGTVLTSALNPGPSSTFFFFSWSPVVSSDTSYTTCCETRLSTLGFPLSTVLFTIIGNHGAQVRHAELLLEKIIFFFFSREFASDTTEWIITKQFQPINIGIYFWRWWAGLYGNTR